MFLIASLTLMPRAELNVAQTRWPAASSVLIRALSFVLIYYILMYFDVPSLEAAISSAILSSFPLILTHWSALRSKFVRSTQASEYPIAYANIAKLLGIALTYQVVASLPRFLDRWFSTKFGTGALSIVEYSYGMSLVPVGIVLNAALILFLPGVLQKSKNLRVICSYKVLQLLILGAILLSVSLVAYNFKAASIFLVDVIFSETVFTNENRENLQTLFHAQISWFLLVILSGFLAHLLIAAGYSYFAVISAVIKIGVKFLVLASVTSVGFKELAFSYQVSETVFLFSVLMFISYLGLKRRT